MSIRAPILTRSGLVAVGLASVVEHWECSRLQVAVANPSCNILNLRTVVLFSYALFDMDGHQVPQTLVTEVGEVFEHLLEEVSVFLMVIFYVLEFGFFISRIQ